MTIRLCNRNFIRTIGYFLFVISCGCTPDQPLSEPVKPVAVTPPAPVAAAPAVEQIVDVPSLLATATEALQTGQIKAAGGPIRKAFSMAPENPQVVFTMAMVLGEEHRYPEAIMMLDELAEAVPETQLPALGQTAQWLVQQGSWDEAETRYRAVLDAVPDATMAHRQLAQLLVRQGRRLEAAAPLNALCEQGNVEEIELRTLLSLSAPFAADASREHLDPIGSVGRARAAAGKDEWDSVIAELQSVTPQSSTQSALLGRAYAEQGDFESLKQWIETNTETIPDNADAWFARGVSAANDQDDRRAVKCFCEAILSDSTDDKAYFQLASSLSRLVPDAQNVSADQAETVLQRATSIARTREIGQQLAQSNQRNLNDLAELAKLLEDLHRPLESLSWQAVRIAYGRSTIAANEQQSQLTEINQQRMELAKNPQPVDKQFVLCGVDYESIATGDTTENKEE
ncbi:Tetratricopeptide repeat protein [Rubripirellula lacrimiformis]|uniref:Tetratricopeptide repeat protein n=1 Tax=Rubripirellula lacrimiformis TaxID=1930273 RepID=A0A517N4D9_9BACT|nr:tetratricopeptide repeat protein [Rubripirellula lacrimiformis]QDT01994.1 Tetratricopeptide repeat protein [Rubripirellula lacrimiformis]